MCLITVDPVEKPEAKGIGYKTLLDCRPYAWPQRRLRPQWKFLRRKFRPHNQTKEVKPRVWEESDAPCDIMPSYKRGFHVYIDKASASLEQGVVVQVEWKHEVARGQEQGGIPCIVVKRLRFVKICFECETPIRHAITL